MPITKTYTSNTLYNDSTGVIAFAEQLKQELINWANYHHVTEELGPGNRPDTQNALNNLFLSVYERFLTFLNDADATKEAINTWKEIENFLADYTDEKTLAEIVSELNANIESRLTVPLESTTGSSTTSAMTQKAITETIDASKTFTTGEKVDSIGIDSEPTAGSDNLVKSGGVQKEVVDLYGKKETVFKSNDNPSTMPIAVLFRKDHSYKIVVSYSGTLPDSSLLQLYGYSFYNIGSINYTTLGTLGSKEFYYTAPNDCIMNIRTNVTSNAVFVFDIYEIKQNISLNSINNEVIKNKEIPFCEGYYFHKNNYIDEQATVCYSAIACKRGDMFIVTANTGNSSNFYPITEYPNDCNPEHIVSITTNLLLNRVYTVTQDCTLYINSLTANTHSVKYLGSTSDVDKTIKSWIISESFQYASITKLNGLISGGTIIWPDGINGTFSITYNNGLPTKVVYTYGGANSLVYWYEISYTNGDVSSTIVIKQ